MFAPPEEAPATFGEYLRGALGLRSGEAAKTGLFFCYLMVASAIFIGGRTVRDTLFLSHHGISLLPWMFIGYGIVSTVLATYYGPLADRVRRDRLIVATCLIGAVSYVAIWAAVRAHFSWIYSVFYIWAEVVGALFVSQFWAFANDYHSSRDAKRLFGLIGAGRVLGIVVCGSGISALARHLGTENLPLAIAALMALVAGFAVLIRRKFGLPGGGPAQVVRSLLPHPTDQLRQPVLAGRYPRLLAGVVFCTFLVCQLADYQFKAIARATYKGDELASYFGTLYAVIGGVAFFIQFFLTARLLARFGLLVALLAMPAALMASSAGLLLWPGILLASALKFSDNAFQYSINEASTQLLYFPFPAAVKGRVRALIDGSVNPSAFGLAGIMLLLFASHMAVPSLTWFTLPLGACWIVLVVLLCREYVGALSKTLRDRRLRHGQQLEGLSDLLARRSLFELVHDSDPETALFAVEQLRRSCPDALGEQLASILENAPDKVQVAALQALEEHPVAAALARVRRALQTAHTPEVRGAALRAYCALEGEDAIEVVLPFLASEDAHICTAALVGLLKHCGLDGVLSGGPELQRLLTSDVNRDRKLAARVLGQIGVRHFYRQLQCLLSDPSAEVRKEAARAARSVPNPKLVGALVALLGDPDAANPAEKALAQFGDEAVPELDHLLANPAATRVQGQAAVKALRRVGTLGALRALVEHIDHPDDRLRRKLLRAIARLHTNLGRPDVVPWSRMRTRIVDELKYTFQTLQDREIIRTAFPGWLMEDTFAHDLFRSKDRLWSLLALSHDPGVIGPCRRSLEMGNPSQRSNALEVLDNTLEEPLKTPFLALLESRSPRETVAAGRRQFQLATVVPQTWLLQNLKGGAGWHRAVALDCIGLHRVRALTEHVKEAMKDPVMLVRETALWAAVRLMGTGATDLLREAGGDSEPMANRLTRWLRDLVLDPDSADKSTGGRALLTTLEEVVFMRHIPIFQGVAAEHLAALAELTEEVFAGPGQEIVQQGDPGDSMFLIVSGQVEVLVDGKRVGLLGPRECFGEMALIDGETRSATVKALESTDLLTLGHDEFHEFLEERSEVASNVLRILCQRIRLLNQQLVSPGAAAPAGGQAR